MRGEMAEALGNLKELYDFGADPSEVLVELAEFVHLVTRLKLVPDAAQDPALTPEERTRGQQFVATLSMPVLTRAWQLLLKGLREVKDSPRPLAAADMVLVRLAYAADLPTPDEALRKFAAMTGGEAQEASHSRDARRRRAGSSSRCEHRTIAVCTRAGARQRAEPSLALARFEDVVALAGRHRDIQLKLALERDVRLVRFEQGRSNFQPLPAPHRSSPKLSCAACRNGQGAAGWSRFRASLAPRA